MNFNRHSQAQGQHAFLSPSKYQWINYDEDKLDRVFFANQAARRGTELHEFAHRAIRLREKLPATTRTLNQYVNDAIGYRMTPEQILYVSENAFGTADCIGFRNKTLRIHDLKTGVIEASVHQLEVYAAFFCLEYKFKPTDIGIELRIYQNDEVKVFEADPDAIFHIMDKTIVFDRRVRALRSEVPF